MIWKFAGDRRYRVLLLVIGSCVLAGLTMKFSEEVSSQHRPAALHTGQRSSFGPSDDTEQLLDPGIYRAADPLSQFAGPPPQVCQADVLKDPLPVDPIFTTREEYSLPKSEGKTGTLENDRCQWASGNGHRS